MRKLFVTPALMLLALLCSPMLQAQHVLSAGPMFHLNFGGGKKTQMSYGFEVAYWNVFGLPYGFDAGIDYERGAWRLYSEAQTGVIFGGLAAGPYLEFRKDNPPNSAYKLLFGPIFTWGSTCARASAVEKAVLPRGSTPNIFGHPAADCGRSGNNTTKPTMIGIDL